MMSPDQPDASRRLLSGEQRRRLADVHLGIDPESPPRKFLKDLVRAISEILRTKVAVIGKRGESWVLGAESTALPPVPLDAEGRSDALNRLGVTPGVRVEPWRAADRDWTLVPLGNLDNPPVVLILDGDWTSNDRDLRALARSFSQQGRDAEPPTARAVATTLQQLTRALADTAGLAAVGQAVLQHVVQAVPSRMASLAVATPEGELSIVATQGYPQALVEHLRIAPGSGVIGSVHQSRRPMLVSDVKGAPGLNRHRPRYETDSFAVVPIVAGEQTLGVIAVTDRLMPGPYTQRDLGTIAMLTAPAALALGRERVWRDAQAYAQAAVIDPVSGLFNRRYFQARLDEELQRAFRQLTSVALLMIDLDEFKGVNDRYGHVAGDQVIRDISEILRRSVRIFDVCTRFGGEEFAVMMPGGTLESAAATAERIRHRVETYDRKGSDLSGLRVTASIGVAVSPPEPTARDLIEQADRALYQAKNAGKNRVITADPDRSASSN